MLVVEIVRIGSIMYKNVKLVPDLCINEYIVFGCPNGLLYLIIRCFAKFNYA